MLSSRDIVVMAGATIEDETWNCQYKLIYDSKVYVSSHTNRTYEGE